MYDSIFANGISPLLISNEFAITIALVVFVMLTAILLTLLIALIASKNFRTVFFRDKPQPKSSGNRKSKNTVVAESKNSETAANKNDADRAENHPEYFDGILTVPLGGTATATTPARQARKTRKNEKNKEIFDAVPTIAIPKLETAPEAYTVSNSQMTRTKNGAAKSDSSKRSTNTKSKQTDQAEKKPSQKTSTAKSKASKK